jgi:hypothetical protein
MHLEKIERFGWQIEEDTERKIQRRRLSRNQKIKRWPEIFIKTGLV